MPSKKGKQYTIDDWRSMTATAVARIFGTSYNTVGQWRAKNGCPCGVDNKYNLADVIKWKLEQAEGENEFAGMPDSARERLCEVKIEQETLKLEKMRGELVNLAELQGAVLRLSERLRDLGEGLQKQFGPEALDCVNECLDGFVVDVEAK